MTGFNRRKFIERTAKGMLVAAVTGELLGCSHPGKSTRAEKESGTTTNTTGNLGDFGLQLYTLRDVIDADPKATLKKVADMGYKQIEGYEGSQGIFWGMSNTAFKSYLDSIGLTMVSTHLNINQDFEKKAAEAGAIGLKYLTCPSLGNEMAMTDDAWKKAADLFNEKGKVCQKQGLRFAYHNHDPAFKRKSDGTLPIETLLKNTDPSLVDFEMDIYWVVTGGEDPVNWLNNYPNRFTLCHVKDRKSGIPISERDASVNLGDGGIDFKTILAAARKMGMKYYIVEQEKYEGTTPLDAARADAEYLKRIVI